MLGRRSKWGLHAMYAASRMMLNKHQRAVISPDILLEVLVSASVVEHIDRQPFVSTHVLITGLSIACLSVYMVARYSCFAR